METRLLYQTDAYLKSVQARVLAVNGSAVALDATVFYPAGGGQAQDLGRLIGDDRTWQVAKVWRESSIVWHGIEGEPLVTGTVIRAELDWDRRYAMMRTHTAFHILCGVVWRDYGAKVTGGNMEPLSGRMDLEFESLRAELVREIEGLDVQADGGTHVASTQEVGRIRIVGYESKGKINKRIKLSIQ